MDNKNNFHEFNIGTIIIGGIYKHYKGTYVEVLNIGRNTETDEDMIIYHHVIYDSTNRITHEDQNDKTIWLRPVKVWFDKVKKCTPQTIIGTQVDKTYEVPRFELVWNPNDYENKN